MTKLYLSSVGIPNKQELLSLLSGQELTVAIIPNAWDVYPEDRRKPEIESIKSRFEELGFAATLVDLKEYQHNDLKQILSENSLVWVMGGNSFYLNYLVQESGLAVFIDSLLDQGLVYGGESAGAVLAGSTLHGVEFLDDPKKAPKTVWEGFGFADVGMLPHWGMEKYDGLLQQAKIEMEKFAHVATLTNEQVLIVDDVSTKIVPSK